MKLGVDLSPDSEHIPKVSRKLEKFSLWDSQSKDYKHQIEARPCGRLGCWGGWEEWIIYGDRSDDTSTGIRNRVGGKGGRAGSCTGGMPSEKAVRSEKLSPNLHGVACFRITGPPSSSRKIRHPKRLL